MRTTEVVKSVEGAYVKNEDREYDKKRRKMVRGEDGLGQSIELYKRLSLITGETTVRKGPGHSRFFVP